MLRAEVELDNGQARGLISGMWLNITAIIEKVEAATIVPANAIVESPDGKAHVFVVDDNTLTARPVEILARQGSRVAVEGIEPPGEVVISTFLGWSQLNSGLEAEVVR